MIYQYDFEKRTKNSISNVQNLLKALDICQSDLEYIFSLCESRLYKEKSIPKIGGTERIVFNPHQELRRIQRRLNKRIFNQANSNLSHISWPSYLYGSIPNEIRKDLNNQEVIPKDYIACARNHCMAKSLMKLDISNFFDNIHQDHVYSIFKSLLKYPDDVSEVLTKLCCYKGNVVQGALTSSYIASAVLFDVEPLLVKRLHRKNLVYTRLVDDITVSSNKKQYDFSYAQSLIIEMLHSKDLPVNNDKTIIKYVSTEPLIVHGLRINFKEPRLPADEVSRIRASVKNLELLAKDGQYKVSDDYRTSFNRCLGRVNKLGRLGHKQHQALLERVLKIPPKPSYKHIKKAVSYVYKIECWHPKYKQTYWYYRQFNKAHAELNILQRSFTRISNKLRERLRNVKPEFKG